MIKFNEKKGKDCIDKTISRDDKNNKKIVRLRFYMNYGEYGDGWAIEMLDVANSWRIQSFFPLFEKTDGDYDGIYMDAELMFQVKNYVASGYKVVFY